jgi:hypothetical protein
LNPRAQYDLEVADQQVGEAIRRLPTKQRFAVRREQARVA